MGRHPKQIVDDMLVCSLCKQAKRISQFWKSSRTKFEHQSWCIDCHRTWNKRHEQEIKQYHREVHEKNKERINKQHRARYQETRKARLMRMRESEAALKRKVMCYYSNSSVAYCRRCKIDDLDVLTIDHINEDGAQQKKKLGGCGGVLYAWLKRNRFPEGYQVLCFNCNFKKSLEVRREHRGT